MCIYEGKITVIGIPEKDSDNEYIIVDDWLYLYTKPTVEEREEKLVSIQRRIIMIGLCQRN